METKIIVIGNSKGVRLPKQALRECRLNAGDRTARRTRPFNRD